MKREIKFRVWHKTEKRYLPLTEGTGSDYRVLTIDAATGNVSMFNAYGLAQPFNYSKDALEVEQYTGLKDKNGKEIYEGDVLQSYPNGDTIFSVSFGKSGDYGRYGWCLNGRGDRCYSMDDCPSKMVVIGNIHDNPELLK